jgi:ElaB/YqjD/DUF883 family membrane-anchored ribosome-binding protein
MMERTAATSAALADELRIVLRQVEELVAAIGEDRDEALKEVRNRVTDAAASAKVRLAAIERAAERKARQAGAAARTYASENPWTTLSIGAAVGLVLGAVLIPKGNGRGNPAQQ